MSRTRRLLLVIVLSSGLLLALAWAALASPAALSLPWWSVDGGGQTFSQGGVYRLGGTAGQPDAGVLSGGPFTLGGGFWRGGAAAVADYQLYLPLIEKNHQSG